jgi:CRISPR/Cas system CMR-associated protein Cmr5 small subunit
MGNAVLRDYESSFGPSSRELYAQFVIRIYKEITGCKIGMFSKLKHIQANNFNQFRLSFRANFLNGFIVPANTFDNVKGNFPIAFQIWDTEHEGDYQNIKVDIIDKDSNYLGEKIILNTDDSLPITKWIKKYEKALVHNEKDEIGLLNGGRTDFQNQNLVFLVNSKHPIPDLAGYYHVYKDNVIHTCIYISVRKCIKADWTNDRDQFLFPNENCLKDDEFIGNCLMYALFHDCNNIQSKYGTNHWIPFSETDVNARDNFESHFMYDLITGKNNTSDSGDLFIKKKTKKIKFKFSTEAKAVQKAGKKLWQYYHTQPTANVNASFYDIRDFFQGRDDGGRMNTTSGDDKYNELISDLRSALKTLSLKIQPKVYEYGFLVG